jgi:hypothetical protein
LPEFINTYNSFSSLEQKTEGRKNKGQYLKFYA